MFHPVQRYAVLDHWTDNGQCLYSIAIASVPLHSRCRLKNLHLSPTPVTPIFANETHPQVTAVNRMFSDVDRFYAYPIAFIAACPRCGRCLLTG